MTYAPESPLLVALSSVTHGAAPAALSSPVAILAREVVGFRSRESS